MIPMSQKKLYTLSQALDYAKTYCAKQEHCQSEVRDKLRSYSVAADEIDICLAELICEGFINEQRYADLFVASKLHQNQWGRIKIAIHLRAKEISDVCIKKAISAIDYDEYMDTLRKVCDKKIKTLSGTAISKKQKLISFLASRGFEFDCIDVILKESGL